MKGKNFHIRICTNSHHIISYHIINGTLHNLAKFTEQYEKVITTNKQEIWARLISDQEDRAKLQKMFSVHIHVFDTSVKELCKIYNVETCSEKTNANKTYEIKNISLWLSFKEVYAEDFNLDCRVEPQPRLKVKEQKKMKGLKYTTACVMCLLSVFIQIVFIYELAPFPTSFSENSGDPKFVK